MIELEFIFLEKNKNLTYLLVLISLIFESDFFHALLL